MTKSTTVVREREKKTQRMCDTREREREDSERGSVRASEVKEERLPPLASLPWQNYFLSWEREGEDPLLFSYTHRCSRLGEMGGGRTTNSYHVREVVGGDGEALLVPLCAHAPVRRGGRSTSEERDGFEREREVDWVTNRAHPVRFCASTHSCRGIERGRGGAIYSYTFGERQKIHVSLERGGVMEREIHIYWERKSIFSEKNWEAGERKRDICRQMDRERERERDHSVKSTCHSRNSNFMPAKEGK